MSRMCIYMIHEENFIFCVDVRYKQLDPTDGLL